MEKGIMDDRWMMVGLLRGERIAALEENGGRHTQRVRITTLSG